jgi:hypothetical protein
MADDNVMDGQIQPGDVSSPMSTVRATSTSSPQSYRQQGT